MNVVNFGDRSCERYRRYFDAYMDNELLVETNHDLLQHLNSCKDCAAILEDRTRLKHHVRSAVEAEQVSSEFVAGLRDRIRTERRSFFRTDTTRWIMAIAAVLLLAIGGLGTLQWGRIPRAPGGDGVFQTVSTHVQEMLRVGLIDHVHCALLSKHWKKSVSYEEMKVKTGPTALGPEFIDLVPAIQTKLGPDFKISDGHRCTVNQRKYTHIILTGKGGTILSLVITEKREESFTQAEAIAVMKASDVPIYQASQGQLQIAAFETDKYLAYVVSNMDRKLNLEVAASLTPLVHEHLHGLEL